MTPRYASLEERMAAVAGPEDECWEWPFEVSIQGYAILNRARVGRLLLGLTKGDGLVARHKCDNTRCVNPAHLEPGTQVDNIMDTVKRGRHHNTLKTHCKKGHEFTEENTYVPPVGGRYCRKCQQARDLEVKARRRNKVTA